MASFQPLVLLYFHLTRLGLMWSVGVGNLDLPRPRLSLVFNRYISYGHWGRFDLIFDSFGSSCSFTIGGVLVHIDENPGIG